jgi:MoaA/NifB/PqqE/SkfB family radical SAM enzyme
MSLTGLHFLLTYRCISECDHCFVWGSPDQTGVFTLARIEQALDQARDLGTIQWVFFEGGEPFLYHPVLVRGAQAAAARGFQVGVVTNGYWATTAADARAWLEPLAGQLHSLSVSTDELHYDEQVSTEARNVLEASKALGIPADMIVCDVPEGVGAAPRRGEPVEGGPIMYRGRAAVKLAAKAPLAPWDTFDECPHEQLDDPGRVHLDPLGNLHLCQGLILGNLFEQPLKEIVRGFRPKQHPIVGPLLNGGPAELARRYQVAHDDAYADACHLCYAVRVALRSRFGEMLGPGQMYGEGLT